MQKIRALLYRTDGGAIVINSFMEHSLRSGTSSANLITLADASQFGTRQILDTGVIGQVFGMKVYVSDNVTIATTNLSKAVVMGVSRTGERPFGYAIKRDPIIEREYHARGRYWDIVAHEEYDFATLHPDAICLIHCYSA
jgi:hypothetical protein